MNKHRRNRHLAIRNIQRTDRFGRMTYREARRKYKAGYRAIPVGKGYFTSWFLLNFGSDELSLAQARKLGQEYTLISEHAESAQFKATMRYDVEMHWLRFQYRGSGNVWQFRLSFKQASLLIDCGRLAECVMRSAVSDLSGSCQFDNVDIRYPYTGISHYSRSEDFNEIVSHSIRDRMQGVSSLSYRSMPLPIFGGYGITKVDK